MKHRNSQYRQKMSRIIDEISTVLFRAGAQEVSLRAKKEPDGMRLLVQADYAPAERAHLEHLCSLLQPAFRDPALAETFWNLAGLDLEEDESSELTLVGQILDAASFELSDKSITLDLFVCH